MIVKRVIRSFSVWKTVPQGPENVIVSLSEAYKRDKNLRKVNLGLAAYRDDNGKPLVLPSVEKAKSIISSTPDHEYLPIEGSEKFTSSASLLAYGDSIALKESRIASIQSLSGTGALRLGIEFIKRFFPHSRRIYIPKPTGGNHKNIITDTGLEYKEYGYYNPDTKGLDFENLIADIEEAPKNSIILFHVCAHNPTGVDPSKDQWKQIQDLMATRQHLALFDMVYQGFASGDPDEDAYPLRLFADEQNPLILAQSFAKNFGLYGETVGNLSVICDSKQEANRVLSQLKIIARPMYSNPPLFGSRVVSTILNTPELKKQWESDLKVMASRIASMRSQLVDLLKEKGSLHDWSHIRKQMGMFAYTGLSPDQSEQLVKKYHIYMTLDGRISLTGLNSSNIENVADAIETVTRFASKI
jgi:aspartate aminotransferase, mitochondrial